MIFNISEYRGMIDYRAGYEAAGELQNGLAALRWGADWILKVMLINLIIFRFEY